MLINTCSPMTSYRWREIHSITSHRHPLDLCCPLMQDSKVLERLLVFSSFPERVGTKKCMQHHSHNVMYCKATIGGSLKLIFTILINLMLLEQTHQKPGDLLWWSIKMHFHGSTMELLQ